MVFTGAETGYLAASDRVGWPPPSPTTAPGQAGRLPLQPELGTIDVTGLKMATSQKFRNLRRTPRSPNGGCAAGVAMLLEVPLVVLLGPVERGSRGDLSDDLPSQRLLLGVT